MDWISVKDRLPEAEESVLIWGPGYEVQEAYIVLGRKESRRIKTPEGPHKTKIIHTRKPCEWRIRYYDDPIYLSDITHWMPLPTSPAQG